MRRIMMLIQTPHRHTIAAVVLSALLAPGLGAQTKAPPRDSLKLEHMRIRAQGTPDCKVFVSTSSSLNADTHISPANIERWIDSATAYAAATPHRAKGEEVRFAWIPITLGISRTITDQSDAFEFLIGGHAISIAAGDIPRIAKLLRTAATATLELSGNRVCPTAPDR